MSAILRKLGWALYAVVVLATFVVSGYFAFSLFVRRGATTVPEIVGLTEDEAAARLSDQGLALLVREGGARFDDEMPTGQMLQQSPGAGSLVKRGSAVEGVVSLGPELVEVPELEGMALPAAQVTLTAAGLTPGRTAGVFGEWEIPGTVVRQDPPAGSRVGRGAPVELYLCREARGRTFLMPDLVYRDYEQVRRFFERHGMRLGSVKFETYEGIAPGVVLRQFPLPGHPLRQSEVISLVVATSDRVGA